MRTKSVVGAKRVLSALVLLTSVSAVAQNRTDVHITGLVNDYSPANVKGGPWEMHGSWTLDLHADSGAADFTAAMTMSDYAMAGGVLDLTEAGQSAHTHHIQLTHANIIWNMTGCPVFSPATDMGFQLSGTVSLITGNGSNAPFETTPPSSTLQICVTGGKEVPYSNLTMVFGGPATTHFGPQAIHGVVRKLEVIDKHH